MQIQFHTILTSQGQFDIPGQIDTKAMRVGLSAENPTQELFDWLYTDIHQDEHFYVFHDPSRPPIMLRGVVWESIQRLNSRTIRFGFFRDAVQIIENEIAQGTYPITSIEVGDQRIIQVQGMLEVSQDRTRVEFTGTPDHPLNTTIFGPDFGPEGFAFTVEDRIIEVRGIAWETTQQKDVQGVTTSTKGGNVHHASHQTGRSLLNRPGVHDRWPF